MPRYHKAAGVISVVLLAAAVLGGCTGGTKTGAPTGTAAATAAGTTTVPSASASTTSTAAASGNPATALAQATVRAPGGTNQDTVDIVLLSLRVRGQLMTLVVRLTPHFADKSPSDEINLFDMSGNGLDPTQVSLVDPVGLKRYLVVHDSDGNPLGNNEVSTSTINGSSVDASYTFAAPPTNVTSIDVYLGPFPPFHGVSIER